jgi:hypothetical protein
VGAMRRLSLPGATTHTRSFYQLLDRASHQLGNAASSLAAKTGLTKGKTPVGQDSDGNKYYVSGVTHVSAMCTGPAQQPG